MKPFTSKKISSEEMAILDNNSEWLGIPKSHLMECAGYSLATEIISRDYIENNSKIVIFCGLGNNGGDGFVAARHLSSYGIKILVVLLGPPEKIRTKEARLNWNILYKNLDRSIEVKLIRDSTELEHIKTIINEDKNYCLIVDGLLGTGVRGEIREPISTAITLINKIKEENETIIKIVSIDVPSGLDPNTGEVPDKAVKADLVVTFHHVKKGMKPNSTYIKEIVDRSIGIPLEAEIYVGRGDLLPTLKERKINTHKGQFGRMLVIGGSINYSGAPAYSSLTGIKFGIDLVITYTPEIVGNIIRNYSPNLIVRTSPGDWLNFSAFNEISGLIEWSNSVLIGPGLGTEKKTEDLLVKLIEKLKLEKKPFVLDADALKLVKNHLPLLKGLPVILTPHEGELEIMTGIKLPSFKEIEQRSNIILNLAKKLDVTLLIKGPYDYISNGKLVKINKTGCPEMSIGGTGDVLAGLCTCFISTENNIFQSACSAAFLNGIVGEYCKKNIGSRFTAVDMINNINKAIHHVINF